MLNIFDEDLLSKFPAKSGGSEPLRLKGLKIVITSSKKRLFVLSTYLSVLTGGRLSLLKAKKSVSNFKLRKGDIIGLSSYSPKVDYFMLKFFLVGVSSIINKNKLKLTGNGNVVSWVVKDFGGFRSVYPDLEWSRLGGGLLKLKFTKKASQFSCFYYCSYFVGNIF